MKKNIALNVFYTLGIVVSVIGLKWAYQAHNFPVVGVLIATAIFFLYLKINIVKDVRSSIKDKEQSLNAAAKDETN
jgi:1,4-dihydroxy-2-naphthoate octaprenyltransferase